MSKPILQIDDVCFSYEKDYVLKHISLSVEANSLCFIMGINGSGKTTLLKNVMGFLSPQTGTIKIDDTNIAGINHQDLSRLVSYVPQAIHINTDFSVLDYLSLGRTPHLKGLAVKLRDSDHEVIDYYASLLEVNQYYQKPFNKLSGGQKQIVAIARSLIQETPLIILDEPMSALDIGRQVDLLKVLRELVQKDKTIVLTTHNPNHALVSDSFSCFLKQGEIAAYGKSSDVITDELLHEIYGDNINIDHGARTSTVIFDLK